MLHPLDGSDLSNQVGQFILVLGVKQGKGSIAKRQIAIPVLIRVERGRRLADEAHLPPWP